MKPLLIIKSRESYKSLDPQRIFFMRWNVPYRAQ